MDCEIFQAHLILFNSSWIEIFQALVDFIFCGAEISCIVHASTFTQFLTSCFRFTQGGPAELVSRENVRARRHGGSRHVRGEPVVVRGVIRCLVGSVFVVVVVVVVGMRVPTGGDDGGDESDVQRRRQTTVVRWHRCRGVQSSVNRDRRWDVLFCRCCVCCCCRGQGLQQGRRRRRRRRRQPQRQTNKCDNNGRQCSAYRDLRWDVLFCQMLLLIFSLLLSWGLSGSATDDNTKTTTTTTTTTTSYNNDVTSSERH